MASKRRRVVTSRPSKNACRTCRARRVKCDEKKPNCWRCESTGRKCDGYATPPLPRNELEQKRLLLPARTATPNTTLSIPLGYSHSWVSATENERNAFGFFLQETAPPLVSILGSQDFIHRAVQVGAELPAVFNALAAVGCMTYARAQIHVTDHSLTQLKTEIEEDVALQQYCKATLSLQKYIDGVVLHGDDVEPVLICSLLFVMLELFRGETSLALSHWRHGQRAIHAEIRKRSPKSSLISSSRTNDLRSTFDIIGKESIRLTGDILPLEISRLSAPHFDSVEHAKISLELLTAETSQWRDDLLEISKRHLSDLQLDSSISLAARCCVTHCLSRSINLNRYPCFLRRKDDLITAHEKWLRMLACMPSSESTHQGSLTLMRLQHFYSYFLLLTSRDTRQSPPHITDASFKHILDLTDRYLAQQTHSGVRPPGPASSHNQLSFSLEPGPLPVLFLIALKCCKKRLRTRALTLLQHANRREGLQFSGELGIYADCIVRFEERAKELTFLTNVERDKPLDYWFQRIPKPAKYPSLPVQGVGYHDIRVIGCRYRYENDPSGRLLELCELKGAGTPPLNLQELWRTDVVIPLGLQSDKIAQGGSEDADTA